MGAKFSEWLIGIVFALVGAGVIIGGIFTASSTAKFKETAVQTTATVVSVSKHTDSDGDTSYRVYLTYNVDGEMYNGSYSTSSYVTEGSTKTVYYDRNNPASMKTTTSSSGGIIMTVFGIPFCAIGLGMIFHKLNKASGKKQMLETGDKIYADFKEVTINYSYSVNKRHPYIIICTGKDSVTGEVRTFKSENLWDNPEYIIKERNITTFPVYIDINNRKKYYLSLEEIEKE